VTGLFCHRHFRKLPLRKLSASVEAPEPHDFAVSFSCVRQRAAKASTSSASNVGDDRDTPLVEAGHAEDGDNGIAPEIRPRTVIRSTGKSVHCPAYYGRAVDSVRCRRCAKCFQVVRQLR
jgi:hypothetical protein